MIKKASRLLLSFVALDTIGIFSRGFPGPNSANWIDSSYKSRKV